MRIGVTIIGVVLASSGCGAQLCSNELNRSEGTCFKPTSSIDENEKPSARQAYLYGSFAMRTVDSMTVAFVIGCRDGSVYTIPFSNETPVQMIVITPSKCSLREYVYIAAGHEKGRKDAPRELMDDVELGPGKAYYIGDFLVAGASSMSETLYRTRLRQWGLDDARDSYEQTTERMRAMFPNFSQFPTEKRVIAMLPAAPVDDAAVDERQACSRAFAACRVACGNGDGGAGCLRECIKNRETCSKADPH